MKVDWSQIHGLNLGVVAVHSDHRGAFIKLADERLTVDQVCVSRNQRAGTLRGLHYQVPPNEEEKLIWCSAGAVFDVVVDLRPEQATYGSWAALTLTAVEPQMLRIPPGVAHGFQTLIDNSEVTYLIGGSYSPESTRTLRWDDNHVNVVWPQLEPTAISDADRDAPPWPPRT